jgi:poly(3-hydroxybutyrate) depolymerase
MKHFNYRFLFALLSVFLMSVYSITAQSVNITVGSTSRNMIMYVPSGIPSNSPLIISCHGMNQDAAYQKSQAQFESIADAGKFAVVFPNGVNKGWDISGTSDINFITAIIDYMYSNYSIDKNRVYLSGFSMGGMFTYFAATKIADKIAAFAPISGYPMGGPNTNSSRPIPIIHTHGTADDVVSYSGVAGSISAWVSRNGCPSTAVVTDPYPSSNPNSNCTKYYYGPGTNGVSVVLMSLEGKGHWISIDPNGGINTSQEIWNFCKNYSLGCSTTEITPYLQIAGESWQQTSNVTINSGTRVVLGPQPSSGGSWSWSGLGTSGTSREQTITPTSSGTATATYTNSCGARSTKAFNITVNGGTTSLTIQENTTGFCSVDGSVASSNSGYTGTGYADTNAATGAGISWSVNVPSTGSYTLKWRYASSSDRPANLKVDGTTVVSNVAFASTGSWTTWTETGTTSVNLAAGTRVIRIEAVTSSGLGNIDNVTITGVSPSAVACSGLKSTPANNGILPETENSIKEATVVSTEYYTISGQKVDRVDNKKGFYIVRKQMSDGSVATSKVLIAE